MPLLARYDLDGARSWSKESLADREPTMWRYRELMPLFDGEQPITLGEGWTPLIHARRLGQTLGLERPPSGVVAIELDEAMAARRRPTAMIAQNDVTALELINRLEAGGLRVPADVSVIGYDDIPAARLDRISLTTLRQDTPRLVERAAALLMGRIDAALPGDVSANRVPPQFVVRSSTGRCRTTD